MNYLDKLKQKNAKADEFLISHGKYWKAGNGVILLRLAVLEFLNQINKTSLVLDVGAGHQTYQKLVEQRGHKYLTADLYPRSKAPHLISDVQSLGLASNKLDAVLCMQVLEHVPRPWIAIKELARVVKKGGYVIISVPHLGYIHNAPHDYYRYTQFGIEILAAEAGLKVVEIKALGGFFCFMGYIRSTVLLPLMTLPVLGNVIFWINYCLAVVDIKIDTWLGLTKLFPLNHIALMKK